MQQVFTRDWGSSSCDVYDDTLTGVDIEVPTHGDGQDPVVIFGHLAGWKLSSRWPRHQQTTLSLILSCQVGH